MLLHISYQSRGSRWNNYSENKDLFKKCSFPERHIIIYYPILPKWTSSLSVSYIDAIFMRMDFRHSLHSSYPHVLVSWQALCHSAACLASCQQSLTDSTDTAAQNTIKKACCAFPSPAVMPTKNKHYKWFVLVIQCYLTSIKIALIFIHFFPFLILFTKKRKNRI